WRGSLSLTPFTTSLQSRTKPLASGLKHVIDTVFGTGCGPWSRHCGAEDSCVTFFAARRTFPVIPLVAWTDLNNSRFCGRCIKVFLVKKMFIFIYGCNVERLLYLLVLWINVEKRLQGISISCLFFFVGSGALPLYLKGWCNVNEFSIVALQCEFSHRMHATFSKRIIFPLSLALGSVDLIFCHVPTI
ncbi:hypothetical protein Tco_1030639, partial [Tanacetum coccineum]